MNTRLMNNKENSRKVLHEIYDTNIKSYYRPIISSNRVQEDRLSYFQNEVNREFMGSLSRMLHEQNMRDDTKKQNVSQYIISLIQKKFDEYILENKDDAIEREEVSGIEKVYLRAFGPLSLDLTLSDISEDFPEFDDSYISQIIDETNEFTSMQEPQKDEEGNLKGFWIDLISVMKEHYDGEHIKVDVYVDSSNGEITFGIDSDEEIYQISLD